MQTPRYKLIVTDLDGTLLNSKVEISQRALSAIGRYQEAGGVFTYATGRTDESARIIAEQAGITAPGIAYNGGKVVNHTNGHVIYETFLDAAPAKKAYIALRKLNKDVIVYLDNCRYAAEYTGIIDKYFKRIKQEVRIIRDIEKVIGDGSMLKKLLVIDPKMDEDLIINAVRPCFGGSFNFVKSDRQYYEFLPPDTSKGFALKILADYLGIGLDETVAVGDHLNDVPMIKAAGLGVAVANAEQETLDAAGYITASNDDDGVAQLIDKVLRSDNFWS